MQLNSVYDKAKYHFETVQQHGLPKEHAMNHAVFFLRWLIENRLVSDFFEEETAQRLDLFKQNQCSIYQIYEWWDCCLVSEMLSETGNAFSMHYFNLEKGRYLDDYKVTLQQNLPTEYHIAYNEANYQQLKPVIDRRYEDWVNPTQSGDNDWPSTKPTTENKLPLTKIANWLLITGLMAFAFVGLTFGSIGVPIFIAALSAFCALYFLIAIPSSLILYLIAFISGWIRKKRHD